MGAIGVDWAAAWAFAKDGAGGDWNADALADDATLVSNTVIDLDGTASCEIGITLTEDNTGAIDGVATIYVLGPVGASGFEVPTSGSPWSFQITPVQNATVYKHFPIDPLQYSKIKIAVKNTAGQELAVSVEYLTGAVLEAA